MKKTLSIIVILYLGVLSVTRSVEAHILKTDGTIGAVLHIDPEDDPIVGQPTYFFFEFKDKTGKFQPALCDCTVTITSHDKPLYSQSLFQSNKDQNLTSSTFSYTFSEKNIYTVTVSGKPIQPNTFQSFVLVYDIRVERTASPTTSSSSNTDDTIHLYHSVLFFIIFAVLIIGNAILTLRRKQKTKTNNTVS